MQSLAARPSNNHLPKLYLIGVPGRIGGASSKILHLLRLLRNDFKITVVLPDIRYFKDSKLRQGYRVMAWSQDLQKQYRWHRFGAQWELLSAQKESALKFLYSLDVFLYPLGHRIKESWGRAVVEAMLTGAVPVVPAGHQFHKLMVHGESGFICEEYREFKATVRELYENYPYRMKISRQGAEYAREQLCNPEAHRRCWLEALSF